ncbi:hypothetical protein VI08_12355 [Luteibacter yeojuensis]|uniref:Secreted protein n=2 Tax=Luteibacter yeojuensis TaxID=345309 RepID=A0A0F3KMM4_9GAMM|nr:hypothetical protein VI08_12355 [Luteibacter yeojuensis]
MAGSLLFAGLLATASAAATSSAPKPTGVYHLIPGIYVAKGTDCASPPNAAIKQYDGKGISTAHTRECVATVASQKAAGKGATYEVSQTCVDAGAGPGKPYTEKQTVDVKGPGRFAITSQDPTVYHYCPVARLPPELRSAAPAG